MIHIFVRAFCVVIALACSTASPAQDYPSKVISIVAPYPPGGSIDLVARLLGKRLGENLGQNVIVRNIPGASGIVGTRTVARSAPDGYTLLLANPGPNAIAPSLYPDLGYDIEKDFAPISLLTVLPQVFTVPGSSPLKSMKDVVAFGRASDKGTFGSAGIGVGSHLTGELFQLRAGTRFTHIPYKGTAPLTVALLAGEISLAVLSTLDAVPHIKSGKLRGLAVASRQRAPALPDVPTVAETVLPDFGMEVWYGLIAPAGTPRPVIDVLNKQVASILAEPAIKSRIADLAAVATPSTPEEFEAVIRADTAKYAEIVKAAGVKVE